MRLDKTTLAGTAAAILSLTASGARSVAWPADYEVQLATHTAAITPSGDNMAGSDAYAFFDSICEVVTFAHFDDKLRNHRMNGLVLIVR